MKFTATRKSGSELNGTVDMVETFETLEEAKDWCESWAVFGFFRFEINSDNIICILDSWEKSTSLFGEPDVKHDFLYFGEAGCYMLWEVTAL